jgi:hypothetical protein
MRKVVKKNFQSGWLCFGLLAAAMAGYAQQETPKPAAPEASAAAPQEAQKPATPETPAAPQETPKAPPVSAAPVTPRRAPETGRNTADGRFSFELNGSRPMPFRTRVRTGRANENATPSDLDFEKQSTYMPGGMVSIPVGRNNTLRFSYFQAQKAGETLAGSNINVFGINYVPGTLVSTTYKLNNAKVSFDYLTWPFPVRNRKFRFKTLWEVQYTTIKASGEGMSVAEDGTELVLYGDEIRSFFYPTFGFATEYSPSRSFRWEFSGSGFAFPGKSATWNAQTAGAVRVGRFEALFGAKAFYFKTSPKNAEYLKGTMLGPFLGIRFYP